MPLPRRFAVSTTLAAIAFALFFAGCGDGPGPTGVPVNADPHGADVFQVRGNVSYEDAVVSQGEVSFAPADGGEPITAPVSDGKYELQAPPGEYRVSVSGKAGETEIPGDLVVNVAVRPNTNVEVVNLDLPEAAPDAARGTGPEEVRRTDAAESNGE